MQSQIRGHSQSLSLSSHIPAEHSRSHEHVADRPAPVDIETGAARSSFQEHPTHTNNNNNNNNILRDSNATTRDSLRIALLENMSPSQKSRNETSCTASATNSTAQPQSAPHEQPVTPAAEELAIQALNANHQQQDGQSQHQNRQWDTSAERCLECGETWKRPLPKLDGRQSSPAENIKDFRRSIMDIILQLQEHTKRADAAYERWKWHHSHCVPSAEGYDIRPPIPALTEPQGSSHSRGLDGVSQKSRNSETMSNKRKSEILYGNGQRLTSKLQKVTFDIQSSTAPPVRPFTPA